ncbi:MAG: hypothetical protein QMC70_06585 [Bacteroidia bacterium]
MSKRPQCGLMNQHTLLRAVWHGIMAEANGRIPGPITAARGVLDSGFLPKSGIKKIKNAFFSS